MDKKRLIELLEALLSAILDNKYILYNYSGFCHFIEINPISPDYNMLIMYIKATMPVRNEAFKFVMNCNIYYFDDEDYDNLESILDWGWPKYQWLERIAWLENEINELKKQVYEKI